MSLKRIKKLNGGSESFSVSLPGWLIELIDHVCELQDLNRSMFFKRASKRLILEILDEPDLWEKIYQAIHDES
jgi:metal-responsive CopG/Arc/MetJ family transcriptional regulator